MNIDKKYMTLALKEATKAFLEDEVPVGCVIVDGNNKVIAKAHNQREAKSSVFSHAEYQEDGGIRIDRVGIEHEGTCAPFFGFSRQRPQQHLRDIADDGTHLRCQVPVQARRVLERGCGAR